MLLRKVGRKIASNCTSPSATIIPLKLKHLDDAHHQLWKPGNMRSAAWPYGYIINVQPQLQHAHVKPSPFPTICMKMRNFLDITARQIRPNQASTAYRMHGTFIKAISKVKQLQPK